MPFTNLPFDVFLKNYTTLVVLIVILVIWEMIWKGIALWCSAKSNQKGWFISILILNTVGILPITYLILNRKARK